MPEQVPAAGRLRSRLATAAAGLLLAFTSAVCLFPTPWVMRALRLDSTTPAEPPANNPETMQAQVVAAVRVGRRIRRAARRLPWRTSCLAEATAAMLALRRSSATLHLGVSRDATGSLIAHAWVTLAGRIVTGGTATPYTEVATYRARTQATRSTSS